MRHRAARVVSRVNPLLTLARAPLLARASCRCYVDGDVCRDSVYSFWKSTTFEGLHWSYATCGGDESLWTDNVIITGLQGKTIRGAIPKSYYPMHYYLDDLGDPVASELVTSLADADRPKYGLWMEYYEELANRAGFTWEWVYTSSGSLHDQSSTWTACVQDVKQGLIDLCIGNFWTVEERLAMSSFVSPTFIDNFYLFVKRPAASQEIDGFAFLKPFSGRLWGLIFSAACIVACLYGLEQIDLGSLKRTREEEISPQQILRKVEKLMTKLAKAHPELADEIVVSPTNLAKGRPSPLTRRASVMKLEKKVEKKEANNEKWLGRVEKFENHFYWGYKACGELSAGSIDIGGQGERPLSVMILQIFWGVFVLVVVAVYTANLAAMFARGSFEPMLITNMEDCKRLKCTICGHSVVADAMQSQFGSSIQYTPISSSNKLLVSKIVGTWTKGVNDTGPSALSTTGCDAFLLDESTYHSFHSPVMCDHVFVGQLVTSLPVSQPVNADFAASFSYWQQRLIGEDKYRTAESSYVKKEHGCDHGEFELGKAEVDGSELVLDLKHMWGLFFVLGTGIVLAVIVEFGIRFNEIRLWQTSRALERKTSFGVPDVPARRGAARVEIHDTGGGTGASAGGPGNF